MTPEKQDKTSELSKHWSPDRTLQILKMQEEQIKEAKLATPSKYTGLGAAITAELIIGFWFEMK